MTKKIIAVLLVVFLSCFSLVAEDIPMDWYAQIVKALDWFDASAFEKFTLERVDEKTVKMSKNKPDTITETNTKIQIDSQIDEYYFRFNLSSEEEQSDKYLFMERAGDYFSREEKLYMWGGDTYKFLAAWYRFETNNPENEKWDYYTESKELELYYDLKGFTSLCHYIRYILDTTVEYKK